MRGGDIQMALANTIDGRGQERPAPDYGADDPTVYGNYSYGDNGGGGAPEPEPIPGWRKPAALVGWGVLIAILIGLIIYGIIQLAHGRPTPAPVTTSTTTTTTDTGMPTTTNSPASPGPGALPQLPSQITLPSIPTVINLPPGL